MIHLTLSELLHVADRTLGDGYAIRDAGLLEAALARTRSLTDGNKRLALAATIALLGVNGRRLVLTHDAAYDLVITVATGDLDDVGAIAEVLRSGSRTRRTI